MLDAGGVVGGRAGRVGPRRRLTRARAGREGRRAARRLLLVGSGNRAGRRDRRGPRTRVGTGALTVDRRGPLYSGRASGGRRSAAPGNSAGRVGWTGRSGGGAVGGPDADRSAGRRQPGGRRAPVERGRASWQWRLRSATGRTRGFNGFRGRDRGGRGGEGRRRQGSCGRHGERWALGGRFRRRRRRGSAAAADSPKTRIRVSPFFSCLDGFAPGDVTT